MLGTQIAARKVPARREAGQKAMDAEMPLQLTFKGNPNENRNIYSAVRGQATRRSA